jgi:hypothetical protein
MPGAHEEPSSKLLGIFVGEEIYYTLPREPVSGFLVHTPIRKSGDNFSVVVNFPEQARTSGSTGYGPGPPITLKTQALNLEGKPEFRLMEHLLKNLPGLIHAEQGFPVVDWNARG